MRGEVVAGEDRDDPRHAARGLDVDGRDARMRVGRAKEGGVHHARQHDVVHEPAAPLQEAGSVRARAGLPNVAVGRVEDVDRARHASTPSITSQMASTIDW